MAKSIRSKSKRKNRTEFRNTIGAEAAKANMAVVQEKLQECLGSGQLNSFDRLSHLFAGTNAAKAAGEDAGGDVVMGGAPAAAGGKDASKIPARKARTSKAKLTGMYGDKTSFKVGEQKFRRGRTSAGSGKSTRRSSRSSTEGRRRCSTKKRSGKKLATI